MAVERLDETVLRLLAQQYATNPCLDRVPDAYIESLVALLDPSAIGVEVAARYIGCEAFWRRLATERWPALCKPHEHGNSWKRLFCERYLAEELEAFATSDVNMERLLESVADLRPFVFRLVLRKLPSHVPLADVLSGFPNLYEVRVTLGAGSELGMNYAPELLGARVEDMQGLAQLALECPALSSLAVTDSLLEDAHVEVLLRGLEHDCSLTALDLSRNRVRDGRAVAAFAERHPALAELRLSHNDLETWTPRALPHLVVLDLRANPLGDVLGQAIFKGGVSDALEELNLSTCRLGSLSSAALVDFLRKGVAGKALRHLDVSANDMGQASATGGQELLEALRGGGGGRLCHLDLRGNESISERVVGGVRKFVLANAAQLREQEEEEQQQQHEEDDEGERQGGGGAGGCLGG